MAESATKILQFSTDDLPEKGRISAFRDIYGSTILRHDVQPIDASRPFAFRAKLYASARLGLAAAVMSPSVAPRGPQHIDSDDLVLNVTLTGGRTVHQRGRDATVREGEAILTTSADPGVVTVPTLSRFISVRVPSSILRPTIADMDAVLVRPVPADRPALRLLASYLGAIVGVDALAAPELEPLVARQIQDLISLTIGATRDATEIALGRGVPAARLQAAKAEIMQNIGRQGLSVVAVAKRLGISQRYVHMLFEREGTTFWQFALTQRLATAHRMLRDPLKSPQTITAIAFECGFADLSHFGRVFRRQFGASPSDVREVARRERGE